MTVSVPCTCQVESLREQRDLDEETLVRSEAQIEGLVGELLAASEQSGSDLGYWGRLAAELPSPRRVLAKPYAQSLLIDTFEALPPSPGTTRSLRLSGYRSWTFEVWVNIAEVHPAATGRAAMIAVPACPLVQVNSRAEHGILSAVSSPVGDYQYHGHGDGLHLVLRGSVEGSACICARRACTMPAAGRREGG